jgi:phage gpG-like protein
MIHPPHQTRATKYEQFNVCHHLASHAVASARTKRHNKKTESLQPLYQQIGDYLLPHLAAIPARPWLGVSDADTDKIYQIMGNFLAAD